MSAGVLCDIAKAFDYVDHTLTWSLWISRQIFEWLKSYLTRQIQVVLCNVEQCCITSGVSRGSVLNPLLFLLYINYLLIMRIFQVFTMFVMRPSLCCWNLCRQIILNKKNLDVQGAPFWLPLQGISAISRDNLPVFANLDYFFVKRKMP